MRSRKRVSKKRRKAQREKKMERGGNQHPWGSEKEEQATGTMRVNLRNPPPFSGRIISQRATKSEPRGSAMILGPVLTFKPREIPRGTRKTSLAEGFSFEGQGKGKTGKNSGRDQP